MIANIVSIKNSTLSLRGARKTKKLNIKYEIEKDDSVLPDKDHIGKMLKKIEKESKKT